VIMPVVRTPWLVLTLLACLSAHVAEATGTVVRVELEPGVYASLQGGRALFLECRPPSGDAGQAMLTKYLDAKEDWTPYKNRMAVAIPYARLNPKAQRRVLEKLFPEDYVDEAGWWHTVAIECPDGVQRWTSLAEWLTGTPGNAMQVRQCPENKAIGGKLLAGQVVLVPMALLQPEMKHLSPKRPQRAPQPAPEPEPAAPTPPPAAPTAPAPPPVAQNPAPAPPRSPEPAPTATQAAPEPVPAATAAAAPPAKDATPAPGPEPAREQGAPSAFAQTAPPTVPVSPAVAETAPTRALEPAKTVPAVEKAPATVAPPPRRREYSGVPIARADLEYGSDREGPYAQYRLKRGESLYSGVVVRLTDFHENSDIHEALAIITRRSGIKDPDRISAGQVVRIPLDMLSDRYQPAQSAERQSFEAVRQEAQVLRQQRFNTRSLDGVVVILDPGHGGRDQGASNAAESLYEARITYDIACRIKELLETQTNARVHMTLKDTVLGFTPTNATRFQPTTHQVLLTTPQYANTDARISANLRWYLANKIYREELQRGTDERKILFASIHCDALFNSSLRGTMVYIPGAQYRRDREQPSGAVYASYQEVQAQPTVTTDAAIRRRDEAVSYNFAVTLLRALARNNPPIKVHDTGNPIRNVIRQSGGVAYVPAVLRNTMVPTKVLVETANMTNPTDRARMADPVWRQAFAEAFVQALRDYYD